MPVQSASCPRWNATFDRTGSRSVFWKLMENLELLIQSLDCWASEPAHSNPPATLQGSAVLYVKTDHKKLSQAVSAQVPGAFRSKSSISSSCQLHKCATASQSNLRKQKAIAPAIGYSVLIQPISRSSTHTSLDDHEAKAQTL